MKTNPKNGNIRKKKDSILFISQKTIGDDLSKFAVDLQNSGITQKIIYKLHPSEYKTWKETYPELSNSDITVVREEVPLYKLLSDSKTLVGVYSTVLYEGLGFGCDTYVLDLPGVENMDLSIKKKIMTLVHSVEDFKQKVNSPHNVKVSNHDDFFEKNSLTKIVNKIDEILKIKKT